MFFVAPKALDKNKHEHAGVKAGVMYGFSRACNSVPLNTIEFIDAVRSLPVVFTAGDNPMPAAILGLEQQNYFVDSNGKWADHAYIPAYIRQYPFIFYNAEQEQKLILCVDEAADHFVERTSDDDLKFFDEGEPSQLTKNALDFCKAVHAHYAITRNFCEDLVKHQLLEPNTSEITLNTGRKMHLGGFQTISEAKVNALSDEVFLEFRKKGWLPFITLALASTSNWRNLVDLAAAREMTPQGNA